MLLTIRRSSVNSLDTGLEVFESCDLGLIGLVFGSQESQTAQQWRRCRPDEGVIDGSAHIDEADTAMEKVISGM